MEWLQPMYRVSFRKLRRVKNECTSHHFNLFAIFAAKFIKTRNLGKAQRESARRPKSDWVKILGRGVKFSRCQSHVARTQMHQQTQNAQCRFKVGQHARLQLFVSGPKFTIFFSNGGINRR